MGTHTVLIGAHRLTGDYRHPFGVKVQVFHQIVINLAHLRQPTVVVGVGLSLMQQNASDHALFLGLAGHFHQTAIGISAIGSNLILQPLRFDGVGIGLIAVLVEEVDGTTVHRHIHQTDAHIAWQVLTQRAPEEVHERETGVVAAEGRHSLAPFPHPAAVGTVDGGEAEERVVVHNPIGIGYLSLPHHVGLSETQEDVEELILCHHARGQECEQRCEKFQSY